MEIVLRMVKLYKSITLLLFMFLFLQVHSQESDHTAILKNKLQAEKLESIEFVVADNYTSKGVSHTYFRQALRGIEIWGTEMTVHSSQYGERVSLNHILPQIAEMKISVRSQEAIENLMIKTAGNRLSKTIEKNELVEISEGEKQSKFILNGYASNEISYKSVWFPVAKDELRLAYQFAIEYKEDYDYIDYVIDIENGTILSEVSWVTRCSFGSPHDHGPDCNHDHKEEEKSTVLLPNTYNVYPWPVESPNFGSRSMETSPWLDNTTASPNGWHQVGSDNYTTSRGNNVDAYDDSNDTNGPSNGDGDRADGGATLEFDFPLDLSGSPADYKDAAITNLFYWSNVTHDVWYNYGFDEPSGNFQEENYGSSGAASDYVYAEAQDGSGTCNANFATPGDGSNPRMQMYLCSGRDGDYDNGVIVHEYGHGISNRLTGGPSASGCLGNEEQMGEGWSDYFGTVMTIESGDQGTDARPMGTWLFGQGPNGGGIRPFPYSTDMNVNPMTYATIGSGVSIPHGVGSVWCTMLWDMTWALIDEYGFDPDIYTGTGGNNIAMQLVTEGLKQQPCSPGFVDGRDGILAADELLYGGAYKCIIWEAFAKRGLGYSASQGSSGSVTDGVEAFDLSPDCSLMLEKTASVTEAVPNETITYTLTASNNYDEDLSNVVITDDLPDDTQFVSAQNGGVLLGNTVTWPGVSLVVGASHSVSFTVRVDPNLNTSVPAFDDDIESGSSQWSTQNSGSTSWVIQNGQSNSSTQSWFANDGSSTGVAELIVASPLGLTSTSELSFSHFYDTEATWDGGKVWISIDGGDTWQDLGPEMSLNGYNSTIFNSSSNPAFSGNSGGFITTVVDLSSYDGQLALIKFEMNCDQAVGGNGWYIDDVMVTNLAKYIPNIASVTDGTFSDTASLDHPTKVNNDPSLLSVQVSKNDISCFGFNDGSATAISSSGTGNYSYSWSTGSTNPSITNLQSGTYSVTVDDGQSTIVTNITIVEPNDIVLNLSSTGSSTSNPGTATVQGVGGTGLLSYLWSNGSTSTTITGLVPGIYSVTATDNASCTKTGIIEVAEFTYCGAEVYDSGGPTGNYSNQEDITTVICPDTDADRVTLTFNSFSIEGDNWDALYIHNGNSISAPLISSGLGATQAGFPAGGFWGNSIFPTFTSTDATGCLTMRFLSDQFVTGDGWDVDVSCDVSCPINLVSTLDNEGYGSLRHNIACPQTSPLVFDAAALGDTIKIEEMELDIWQDIIINQPMGQEVIIQSDLVQPLFNIQSGKILSLNGAEVILENSGILNSGDGILESRKLDIKSDNPKELNSGTLRVLQNGEVRVLPKD